MATHQLRAAPLTRESFAPFGDVIETDGARHYPINRGAVERYHDLAAVDVGDDGRALVSIFECTRPATLPVPVDLVERHPLGSQAFIPVGEAVMCVVVAPPGDALSPADLRAFVTNGRQGVNYHRGTWHMPLVAFRAGQRFLVVDRGGPGDNCEERGFNASVAIVVEAGSLRDTGVDV
ncbi:MAG: ureidoglycolate lyase [Gammaproteobacteria bacterium]|nr:ureidoglycolate lyase [Gammaproteobacteria bacterium]